MPRVSVIIPCFNQGHFLDEAVDSVLAQSLEDFETVIVNDGSTDGETNRILSSYDRPKTRVISTENQGLATARNNGIREARGEYILPLDADDRIGSTYLEQAVRLLDGQSESGIVYCRAQLFGAVDTRWQLPEFSLQAMLLDNCIFCSALFRKDDWERVGGYDETLRHGWEDYDFWLSLLELGRQVYQIPQTLFFYRVSENSMVRARPRQHKLDTFTAIYRKHQQFFSDHIEVWVDKLLDVRDPYHEACLVVNGQQDVDQASRYSRKVGAGGCCLVFDVPDDEEHEIIFRPAGESVIVRIEKINMKTADGKEKHLAWKSNADLTEQDICYFSTSTPYVQIILPEPLQMVPAGSKLVVEVEYLAFGAACLPLFVRQYQRQLDRCLEQKKVVKKILPSAKQPLPWLQMNKLLLKRMIKSCLFFLSYSNCKHYWTLFRSGLFDASFYLNRDPGLDPIQHDLLIHYIEYGWREKRHPNGLFDSGWYVQEHPEARETDPLLHYINTGWQAGHNPNPLFFTDYYAGICPESTANRMSPLRHYLWSGCYEGKDLNPFFDSVFYLAENGQEIPDGMNPLEHYLHYGFDERFHPQPFFDTQFYLEDNPALSRLRIPLLLHYLRFGAMEGRSPNRFFDPVFYRQHYDIEDRSGYGAFQHYVTTGCGAQYRPNRLFDPCFYAEQYPEFRETSVYPLLHYQESGVLKGYYPCREIFELQHKPVISIITPVYNTDELLLRKCIHSVLYQAYPHWQLCLVDDGSSAPHILSILKEYEALDARIKTRSLVKNQGIAAASNEAAALATGDYLGFLDHDDELTMDALYEVVCAINERDPDVLYSDEDLVNRESRYLESFFKPNFNPELLLCHNYITHFVVVKRLVFKQAAGFADNRDGAQDYDLLLKLTEQSQRVHHIARTIYHWRAFDESTSINHQQKSYADEAGRQALAEAFDRRSISATAEKSALKFFYRPHRKLVEKPLISLLVYLDPHRAHVSSFLDQLLQSVSYPDFEVILSVKESALSSQLTTWKTKPLRIEYIEDDAGQEVLWRNYAANASQGEYLLFLHAETVQLKTGGWIESLLEYSQDDGCGVIGGRMNFPDSPRVHQGRIPDLTNTSSHYKAANWRKIGETVGRGKYGATKGACSIKSVWIYPLTMDYRATLHG